MTKSNKHFHFTLVIIIAAFIFVFWEELIAGGLHIWAWSGNPHAERALGEYYNIKAWRNSRLAAIHYQHALNLYKMDLPLASENQRRWIEFIIGTHYECGRGVPADLQKAREWYQRSVDNGFSSGREMLDRVKEALDKHVEESKD